MLTDAGNVDVYRRWPVDACCCSTVRLLQQGVQMRKIWSYVDRFVYIFVHVKDMDDLFALPDAHIIVVTDATHHAYKRSRFRRTA